MVVALSIVVWLIVAIPVFWGDVGPRTGVGLALLFGLLSGICFVLPIWLIYGLVLFVIREFTNHSKTKKPKNKDKIIKRGNKKMDSKYLSYSSSTKYNREVFLLNYGREMAIFEENNSLLHNLGTLISEKKDDEGNAHIGLLPLVLIIERQTTIAFDCLSRYQSYTAWMVFRPALESLLIIGKFIDDPENARIWKNKEDNFKEYLKIFQGKALVSKSLPQAEKYQKLLSAINDEFMHANYVYFAKNHSVKPFNSKKFSLNIQYFDDDFLEHKASLFSFLHIYRLMIVSLGKALALKFKEENVVNVEFESMEKELKYKVIELVKEHPNLLEKCRKFGLWDV